MTFPLECRNRHREPVRAGRQAVPLPWRRGGQPCWHGARKKPWEGQGSARRADHPKLARAGRTCIAGEALS